MAIKSGTLRRKIDESIDKKIISNNLLLLLIAYLKQKPANNDKLKKYADLLLLYGRLDKGQIISKVHSIKADNNYCMSEGQADRVITFIDNALKNKSVRYNRYYIKDSLLKCYGSKGNYKSSAKALKAYIYNNDLIELILERLNCTEIVLHRGQGDNYYTACNPNGDRNNAVKVYCCERLNVINYTRNLSKYSDMPDIITLVQYYKQLDFNNAVGWLQGTLKISDDDLESYDNYSDYNYNNDDIEELRKEQKEKQRKQYEQALNKDLKLYNSSTDYSVCDKWFKEGIITSITKRFGIKTIITSDKHYNYAAMPIRHYESGEIIAISFRVLSDLSDTDLEMFGISKYRITAGYNKRENIYGLFENKQTIIEKGQAVIFEAEKSVLKRATIQDNTGLAIQGHNLTDKQAEIIASLDLNEVIIAFDKDIHEEEICSFCQMLINKGCRTVSYILDRDNLLDEKDSPTDKGDRNYRQLFDNRIKYTVS
ncbi:MAG: hypothetical protein IJ806_00865 [Ruminococcus sp.]|nr:hypothetical protein [Ruminococcus sp.]